MARILVTPRSVTKAGGHPSLDKLRDAGHEVLFCAAGRQPTEEELCELLPGCEGYLAGVEPVTADVLDKARGLRVISRNGTGVENVDQKAAEANGIQVLRAAGANARGVAELTIGLLFALSRSIPFSDAGMKASGWERRKGAELQGKRLGVVGCGVIGRMVSEMACCIGMSVRAYDVQEDASFQPRGDFAYAPMEEVLERSDFVTLHCPPMANGQPLVTASIMEKMLPGVFLVNTARAGLVDADALLGALDSGQVAGAALDVFEQEPPADTRLVKHERVVATPHIGGFTNESVDRAMYAAVDNMLEAL